MRGGSAHVDAAARYLYGAPGAGLEISGELVIEATPNLFGPGLENYTAGLQDEAFEPLRSQIETSVTTDAAGRATIEVPIPQVDAPRPVAARILLRAGEAGGRAVERVVTLPVRPAGGVIAVRKLFDNLSDGAMASFGSARRRPRRDAARRRNLRWSLYRVNNEYQWYNSDGRWGFERVKSSRRIADGRLDATAAGPARLSAPVSSGSAPARHHERRRRSAADEHLVQRGLVGRRDSRHAGLARSHARQTGLCGGRRDEDAHRVALCRQGRCGDRRRQIA